MNWNQLSDKAILQEITHRVKQKRLNQNLTQQQLADKAGVHKNTITNFERGKNTSIISLIQILRAFNELQSLDQFMPEPGVSPIELLKLKGKERERASGKGNEPKTTPS